MEKLKLIKFGGSLITDKQEYKTPDIANIKRLVEEFSQVYHGHKNMKYIIGHGVGSYGHIEAKRNDTINGYKTEEQQLAFSKIHNDVVELNNIIATELIQKGIPIIRIYPLNVILSKNKQTIFKQFRVIEEALRSGFVPLLFGDVILDTKLGSTIYSADKSLPLVAEYLLENKKYEVEEMIFVGDYDGVEGPNGEIISRINKANFEEIKKAFYNSDKTDVTGSMEGKVTELLRVAELGISTKIINGGNKGRLRNVLAGERVTATKINSMKATAVTPANIAFVKFWGRKNESLVIPYNSSISMTMSNCITTTTVEFSDDYEEDTLEVTWEDGTVEKLVPLDGTKTARSFEQIERVRKLAGINYKAKIVSKNNFPASAGIASSASSLCALTHALAKAAGLDELVVDRKELSKLVRMSGSGSAIRSVFNGFTEWIAGMDHDTSYAEQIASGKHWDLVDIVAVVNPEVKYVSSSGGHKLATTSNYFKTRLDELPERIRKVREAIIHRDFPLLGQMIEQDAVSMHTVMMTSTPPIYYWSPGTISVMQDCIAWRKEGLEAYWTMDAGANVHVICRKEDAIEVEERLLTNKNVQSTIYNDNSEESRLIQEHLF